MWIRLRGPTGTGPSLSRSLSGTCLALVNMSISDGSDVAVRGVYMQIPLIKGCTLRGRVLFDGQDPYPRDVDPVEMRRRIGMVFQNPNPFPKGTDDNIAFGARINGYGGHLGSNQGKLMESGYALSGGQHQRQ